MKTAPFYISIILFLVAIVVVPVLSLIGFVYAFFRRPGKFSDYLLNCALSMDQTGAVYCSVLFNDIMIKAGGYKFGNIDETASSAFGKNEQRDTLSKFGQLINRFLNWLDPNHSIDSIEINP